VSRSILSYVFCFCLSVCLPSIFKCGILAPLIELYSEYFYDFHCCTYLISQHHPFFLSTQTIFSCFSIAEQVCCKRVLNIYYEAHFILCHAIFCGFCFLPLVQLLTASSLAVWWFYTLRVYACDRETRRFHFFRHFPLELRRIFW